MTQPESFKFNAKELPYTAYLNHEKLGARAGRELVICRRYGILFRAHADLWHYKHGRTKVTIQFNRNPQHTTSTRVPTSKVKCKSCKEEFGPGNIFPG